MNMSFPVMLSSKEDGSFCLRWENPFLADEGRRAVNLIAQQGTDLHAALSQLANAVAEIQHAG
jgi:hypothetical protein